MTTFRTRLASALEHEKNVTKALTERGWLAEQFGQAMLSEPMRDHLRRVKTSVRWMPDIIAAKSFPAGERIIFVDAKAGEKHKETGNHDVERAALESAERWIELSGGQCPYYFVFSDGGVATPGDVREACWDGFYNGNGSGTPFVLFKADLCRPFHTVFGAGLGQSEFVDG
jgi:hypothetical protein